MWSREVGTYQYRPVGLSAPGTQLRLASPRSLWYCRSVDRSSVPSLVSSTLPGAAAVLDRVSCVPSRNRPLAPGYLPHSTTTRPQQHSTEDRTPVSQCHAAWIRASTQRPWGATPSQVLLSPDSLAPVRAAPGSFSPVQESV